MTWEMAKLLFLFILDLLYKEEVQESVTCHSHMNGVTW